MFKNNKVNWALAIIALIAFLVVFLFSQTPNADAHPVGGSNKDDARQAVTVGEFYSLKKNMTRQEVVELLDGPGHVGQDHTRWYRMAGSAPKFVRIVVTYDNNLLKHGYMVAKKVNNGSFDVPLRTDISAKSNGEDTRDCATIGEFGALQPRMTRHEVYTIMDGQGYTTEPQVRTWDVCKDALKPGQTGVISVWFKKQRAYTIYWIQMGK